MISGSVSNFRFRSHLEPLASPKCALRPIAERVSAMGHKQTLESGSGMSALPPEADMLIVGINVC